MNLDEFSKFLLDGAREAERLNADTPRPIASVFYSQDGKSLDIHLDTSESTYGDWIKGEGGDITIKRSEETKKVAGAHLPLYAKTLMIGGSSMEALRIDLEAGQLYIVKDGRWQKVTLLIESELY